MAIETIKKITVVAHKSREDAVVDTLVRAGTVHVDRVAESDLLAAKHLSDEESKTVRGLAFSLSQVEFLLGFLRDNAREKPGFWKTMIKEKYHMTVDDFLRASERVDLPGVYKECSGYERRMIVMRDERSRLEAERDELENWTTMDMPLDDIKGHEGLGLRLVRISTPDLQTVRDELEAEAGDSSLEVVSERGTWTNCILLFHPAAEEGVNSVLSKRRFEDVVLPSGIEEPEERLEMAKRELAEIERRHEEVLDGANSALVHVPALEIMREFLVNERNRIEVTTAFGETDATVAIEGWLIEPEVERTVRDLEKLSDELSIDIEDPDDEENPPVCLKNPKWAKPFEVLMQLFGSPNRQEYDPTVVVAISFMIFFGFCLGDVGYGILLVPAFLLMRKYLPLGRKAKDLLLVLTYGSAWAIVLGVFSGSWFGIELRKLPSALRSVAVLDGLSKTVVAMGVAIGIGLLHMLWGVGIEFRDNWRQGNKTDALIDQGLVFFLFVGGGSTLALAVTKVIPLMVFEVVLLVAIVAMLATLGRSAASIAGKVVNGLYETYGTVVGFVSDAISYVRLFALGLSTVIIAFVINTMAGMVKGVAPVVGLLLMVVILIIGHTFNIAINLLGAFVHPLRLEFVEFFGKFYDDGGREFKPLGIDSKIVMIEEKEGA